MRKSLGVLLATASLLLPVVVMASPANAATGTVCTSFSGGVHVPEPGVAASLEQGYGEAHDHDQGCEDRRLQGRRCHRRHRGRDRSSTGCPTTASLLIKGAPRKIAGTITITWNTKTTSTPGHARRHQRQVRPRRRSRARSTRRTVRGQELSGRDAATRSRTGPVPRAGLAPGRSRTSGRCTDQVAGRAHSLPTSDFGFRREKAPPHRRRGLFALAGRLQAVSHRTVKPNKAIRSA